MIAVTADIHAHNHKPFSTILKDGRNSRLVAILDAVRWIAKDAKKKKCQYFFIAGDLFHSRRSIEISVLSEVAKLIDEISDLFKQVFIVVGNHDLTISQNANSIGALKRKNVSIVDRPTVVDCSGIRIACVPWVATRKALRSSLKRLCDYDGIIAHAALDKAWSGPSDWEVEGDVKLDDVMKGQHRWALLGHFHKTQSWEDGKKFVAYVGSPIQHSFGERDEKKGYWIVKKSGTPKFIANPDLPKFVLVENVADVKKVKEGDHVRTIGAKAEALKRKVAAVSKTDVVAVRDVTESIKQRLPHQDKGDRKIVEAFVEAVGAPESVDPRDLADIGVYLLKKS